MNKFQTELYNNLMVLVSTNEAFYMKDQELDGITYRVFSYRLASYTDFLLPGALECRGIMYEIDGSGQPIRLVVMPFSKFFNVGEVSSDLDQLALALIRQGRLSQDVYDRIKKSS